MIQLRRDGDRDRESAVLEALSHRRRRRVLRVLLPGDPLPLDDLVGSLTATERDRVAGATATERRLRVELHHRHLPKLVDAGLVEVRDGRVAASGAARADPLLEDLLAVEADDWDEILACLADERRRAAVAALADCDEPVDVPVLAFEVVDRIDDPVATDVDAIVRELHHLHLPKLADAGLVAVEDGGTTVRYLGHADLEDVASGDGAGATRQQITH